MNETNRPLFRFWLWAGILLTTYKVWLTRAQPVFAIGSAAHDDRLFLQLAESIINGRWLGTYSQMTLAKGPFYSIWVALLYWLCIPLGLGVQLAYAAACAGFARACRPAIRSGLALFAIYTVLLWNPMSFEVPTMGRIIRQQIYTPLGITIFAGLVAWESWRLWENSIGHQNLALKIGAVFVPAGIAGLVYWLIALAFKIPAARELLEFALARFKKAGLT